MNVFEERGITTLDLHGVKHYEVFDLTHEFVLRHQDKTPLIIICGDSVKMIELVSKCCKKMDFTFSEPRFGIIRIERV